MISESAICLLRERQMFAQGSGRPRCNGHPLIKRLVDHAA